MKNNDERVDGYITEWMEYLLPFNLHHLVLYSCYECNTTYIQMLALLLVLLVVSKYKCNNNIICWGMVVSHD